ncbi:C6 transcriptional factoral factor [Mycena venus]|uniref:C6 transcriptional factoral factor n=1 Tax=Mycena venus TaxID=2733690 RepID=A0A8H6XSM4_9AGAR|nr:C6 transcriptional factoral factor [Mycena venus]
MDPAPSTSAANYAPPPTPSHAGGGGYPPSSYAGSEGDEREAAGDSEPPKKKRRRQALSCTECKRRKIRCDRTQPCAPCVRRGDQAKCQWHVVEPAAEKYVPRSEYDTLRTRVDSLEEALRARVNAFEDYIYRLPPHVLASHPPPPGLLASGLPGHPEFINAPPGPAQGHNFNPGQSPSYTTMAPPGQQAFNQPLPPMQSFPGSGQQGSFAGGAHGQGHASGSSRGTGPFSGGIAPSQTQTQHPPPQTQVQQQQHSRRASRESQAQPPPVPGRSASFSPTTAHARRTASNSPTQTIFIAPAQTQRQRSGSQSQHPPPSGTVAPWDIQRRAISSSPVHRRASQTTSISPAQTQTQAPGGGQWGESFRSSFPAASPGFPSAAAESSADGGGNGDGNANTGTAPHTHTNTIVGSSSRSGTGVGGRSFSASPAFSPRASPAFSSIGSGVSSGTSASAGRASAGSLSSFGGSSSGSSFSSATPTTYSYTGTPGPYTASPTAFGRGPEHGQGMLYQPLHLQGPGQAYSTGGTGEGTVAVPAQALARIVRPDVTVPVDVKREWDREDIDADELRGPGVDTGEGPREAPKNRPAQAPQGARLRAGLAPWLPLLLLPLRLRDLPPIQHAHIPPPPPPRPSIIRIPVPAPRRARLRPTHLRAIVMREGTAGYLSTLICIPRPRRRCRLGLVVRHPHDHSTSWHPIPVLATVRTIRARAPRTHSRITGSIRTPRISIDGKCRGKGKGMRADTDTGTERRR